MARQQRGERTREAILEAALAIAGADGTAAVTHRAVAERAGVAVGSITYHFETTTALLEEALRLAGERERERVAAAAPEDPGDAAGWVDGLVDHLLVAGEADRERKLAAFELMLESARRPHLRAELGEWQGSYLKTAETALTAAGAKDPVSDARMLLTALLGLDLVQLATGGFPREVLKAAIAGSIDRLIEP
jgi:TetR/AcrR family transcriptional regulator, regulator of biofilm formation and stress response